MVISVEQPPSSIKSPLPHADTVGGGVAGHGHASTWLSQGVAGGDTQSSNLTSMQHIPPSNDSSNSWEARAFAEDASSLAAGIWPPRSYPCSFCRREFRSAQALGGHMNVHRRDRARLRQLSPTGSGQTLISTAPSSNLVQADQYSAANLDLAFVYPNGSVSKFTAALPASGAGSGIIPTLSISTTSPATSIFPLNNSSVDIASSFPLRLQLLASEAASSLMQNSCPKSEPSDLLCLWPTSATINTTSGLQQSMLTATNPNGICRAICPAMTICSEAPLKLDMALTNSVNSLQLPNIADHTSSSIYNINGDQSSLVHSVAASSNGVLIPSSCRRTAHEAALHVSVEDESPKKKAMYISSPELYKMTVVEPNSMQANMDMRSFNGEHEDTSKRTDDQLGTAPPCGAGAGLDLELRLGHY